MTRFDGQPVFGRLVGGRDAGRFRLGPAHSAAVTTRRSHPNSATLETTWRTGTGRLSLTEGMVAEVGGRLLPSTMMVRRLVAEDGPVEAVIEFDPRLGERHRSPTVHHRGERLVCSWPTIAAALVTTPALRIDPGRVHTVVVDPEQPLTAVMSVADREPLVYVDPATAWAALDADERRWQDWCREIDPRLRIETQ